MEKEIDHTFHILFVMEKGVDHSVLGILFDAPSIPIIILFQYLNPLHHFKGLGL
jgi:hypothetical protein